MANPDLELQGAIVARLKARAALTAIVAQRIPASILRLDRRCLS